MEVAAAQDIATNLRHGQPINFGCPSFFTALDGALLLALGVALECHKFGL